nr:hypothetical protein [Halomonas elongata]
MRERRPGESRVALTPPMYRPWPVSITKVFVETGAGDAAGFHNDSYRKAGAEILETRAALLDKTDIILCVDGAHEEALADLQEGHICIGMLDP